MLQHSTNIETNQKDFQEYMNNQYNYWFAQGRLGIAYTGSTYIGYMGWNHGTKLIESKLIGG